MILDLWPECEDILNKCFVYDKIFDLLAYDSDFSTLANELGALKQETFDSNYRFIFLHYDTDYYLYPGLPGLILTNLQRLLVELDIPNYFCLIITNHTRIKSELEYLCRTFTKDTHPIGSIVCQLQQCHVTKIDNIQRCNLNNQLEFKYSCFNNAARSHRHSLISLLHYKKLLPQGLVSYVK